MTKGRFEGLTDVQWLMIAPLLPVAPRAERQRTSSYTMEACLQHNFVGFDYRDEMVRCA